ncbi:PREDICTED: ADAMTS-like protein 1 isoform X2 [Nicrophorus vespilloides]|uniref:ADAMTS-like protein 1 isoform X2 n=1 Tax=Nicrophorus vespilloides TaxID=110193 RepID=A0ABM1N484_NICVS|nr:PREDICTED: ADAMTS-like protein 1 isoform X2 [Nicrophorus vespilloides]
MMKGSSMKRTALCLMLLLTWGGTENATNPSSSGEVVEEVLQTIEEEDNSSQELSSQLQEIEIRANGWTAWSEWSACSRSCDGGVSHQLRRCRTKGCRGENIRYKICNMQPCPESHEFREDQCSAYDTSPYEGTRYTWTPHYDDVDPCALTCRGKTDEEDAVMIVARLAEKVQDGTRCRPGSLDMCIDGKCQRVGCDLRIGSNKQIDACGVCGGDGSSCSRPLYHWTFATLSLCSVTCGGGYKMSRPVCQNRVSGEEVEEQLCNASQKPDASVVPCNMHNCPPKWHSSDWGSCSVTCGGGSKIRQVHCVEEANNTKIRINELKCSGYKPRFQEACNQFECPKWHTTQWSGCSVSCGSGIQVRVSECRDHEDRPNDGCPESTKPTPTKPCSTGIQCPFDVDEGLPQPAMTGGQGEDLLLPGLYHTQPLIQPYPPPAPAHAERLVGEQIIPSESTDFKVFFACGWVYVRFIPEEWGPCSVTCGEGTRRRDVHCKIFLEFSRTIAKLPDRQCSGPKPSENERCYMEPCSSERIDIKDDPFRQSEGGIKVVPGIPGKSYTWREQGYTHCSATCLGGVQELIVNCVRDDNQKIASPYLCPRELKPEILIRTCNDHPCPPRWNYSDFQPCTQSCGIGIQTREVNCIHEVTHGGGNTVVVPNNMCPEPQPPDRQYCNVLDCPVKWKVSDWSKCNKICGGGEKSRKVECKQVMAQNHTVDRPHAMCPNPKPQDKKPCNTKSCVLDTDKPIIETSNSTFIQHDVKKTKISLKIGGAATVYHGTIIKIKCPVKRFNRTKIQWAKDHQYLSKSKKFKMSKKGALRVTGLTYRDSGVYTCVAGRSSADLTLTVRPKPGEFINSEEVERHVGYRNERVDFEIADVHPDRDSSNPMFDDRSHERRPDMPSKQSRKPKTTPPSPVIKLDYNSLNGWPPSSTPKSDHDQMIASHLPANSEDASVSSSGSRNMPHFQKLISNLQTFSNSRGHRMVAFPFDELQTISNMELTTELRADDDENEDEEGSVVVLGKGLPEHLKFEWILTDWSKCSEPCGGNGLQMRTIHCIVRLHNKTQGVKSTLCDDAGLETPEAIRKCGLSDCPKWVVGEWSRCSESKCFAWNTAMQRRDVQCQNTDNFTLPNGRCNFRERPIHRQECFAEKCVGKWKVGAWSKCSAGCDMQGVKYRKLQCVWFGTKKPADSACKDKPRPPAVKTCKGPPCTAISDECKDYSMFCPNVKTMNMCRLSGYQQQCCVSCGTG